MPSLSVTAIKCSHLFFFLLLINAAVLQTELDEFAAGAAEVWVRLVYLFLHRTQTGPLN